MASKPYAELVLRTGQKVLYDADPDHIANVEKYKWAHVTRKGESQVMARAGGFHRNAMYLGRLLFKYRVNKEMLIFKNGNRFDFRSENVAIVERSTHCNHAKPRTTNTNFVNEVRMNGCLLKAAPEGTRCADYIKCQEASACLDFISHKTEWDGWHAITAG